MTGADWLEVCRDAAAAVSVVLDELPTRLEREPRVGDGEGGDETTAVDAAAEAAVVARLERVPAGFTLVSEELGRRVFGDGGDGVTVVCDPIDGSLNAKRGIPFFSLSLAVASGPRMEDVELGFVHDFGTGEEWVARHGGGAFLNDVPLDGPGPKDRVEILSPGPTRGRPRRICLPDPRDGLAGALALPPRRRAGRRRRLPQAREERRHRRRAAPGARARLRGRPA